METNHTNTPTEEQLEWSIAIMRAAATGAMMHKGKRFTQADVRKAERIYRDYLT